MSNYTHVISYGDRTVQQFNSDTAAATRTIGQANVIWSPYPTTNYDSTTGLPTLAALGAQDFQAPCGITADASSIFVLDTMTCRVLRFLPNTGTVVAAFGGRRGIGAGHIEIDTSRRSIIALANDLIWLSDNAGDYMVSYSRIGVFQNQYSISGWSASAVSASNPSFDQITGWAYDPARHCYWGLAQGSATVSLVQVSTAGAYLGSINLTTRLLSTTGASVTGHGGTAPGRLKTRGLFLRNGYLVLYSGTKVFRVDLASSSVDAILYTGSSDVAPGDVTATLLGIGVTLQGEATGVHCTRLVTLATATAAASEIGVGYTMPVPDGITGHVNAPWDMVRTPNVEETSARTARTADTHARIRVASSHTIQARANIHNRVTRTISALGRILRGQQKQVRTKARIQEASTVPDHVVERWNMDDSLGAYSRGLTLQTSSRSAFQVGDTVTVYGGYQQDRIRLMQGVIDDIGMESTPDSLTVDFNARDQGAHEIDSHFLTKSWRLSPPQSQITAFQIIEEAGTHAGVSIGSLAFPNYPVYGMYQVVTRTVLDIVQELMEPWNQFPHISYFMRVREGVLSVYAVPWTQVPSTGQTVSRRYLDTVKRSHQKYLASPKLTGFTEFIVTGSTYTVSLAETRQNGPDSPVLGPTTRIEYFRSTVPVKDEFESIDATLAETVITETTMEETVCGDKSLSRIETIYSNQFDQQGIEATDTKRMILISRTTEENTYFEPTANIIHINEESGPCPSHQALIKTTVSVREGLDPDLNTNFMERFRTQTEFFYDDAGQLAVEATVTHEYDTTEGKWKVTELSQRTHSQTTGGSLRTHRTNFTIDSGGPPILDSGENQQIGGTRPKLENATSRYTSHTFQARAPAVIYTDIPGPFGLTIRAPNLPTADRFVWTYENPHFGQQECETLRELALEEQTIQLGGYRWDVVNFKGQFIPNLQVGSPIHLEVSAGVFVDYWLESLTHDFSTSRATTSGQAKRLTTEVFV